MYEVFEVLHFGPRVVLARVSVAGTRVRSGPFRGLPNQATIPRDHGSVQLRFSIYSGYHHRSHGNATASKRIVLDSTRSMPRTSYV